MRKRTVDQFAADVVIAGKQQLFELDPRAFTPVFPVNWDATNRRMVLPKFDIHGNLITAQAYAGDAIGIKGTYTRTGGAGTGQINVVIADGDYAMLMYGNVAAGAVKVGAGDLNIEVIDGDGDVMFQKIGYVSACTAGEICSFPGIGQVTNDSGRVIDMGCDVARMMEGGQELKIRLATMANAETFTANIIWFSREGTAPSVTATGGTWA